MASFDGPTDEDSMVEEVAGKRSAKLPTFTDVLRHEMELDFEAGLVKRVQQEAPPDAGPPAVAAEGHAAHADLADAPMPSPIALEMPDLSKALWAPDPVEQTPVFLAGFPVPVDHVRNDETDLLTLARTSPVALWVFGQCDAAGEYKTEVCRRLADSLGLQWLQPTHLLELAVKTPVKRRTKLMHNCVELLRRGMAVTTGQVLALTLEMMDSARCKTNGYVLDFPPMGPADMETVAQFAERVVELSGSEQVQWNRIFHGDLRRLPKNPEPEPPEPPPGDGDDAPVDGDDAADGADAAPAAAPDAPPAAAGDVADGSPEGAAADVEGDPDEPVEGAEGAELGAEEGLEEGEADDGMEWEDVEPEDTEAPFVPNPLANTMPRRLLFLSMKDDELKAWRLAVLKARHHEREALRKKLEEAGEELPEEEEEEPVEVPVMPEEEADQDEIFQKGVGDLLETMAPFLPPKSLQEPVKPPPLPDETKEEALQLDIALDLTELKSAEEEAVRILQEVHQVPFLRLEVDGRTPVATAELLEVVAGGFRGMKIPLPKPLEGGADEPKDLLRVGLSDQQTSCRWSLWRLHCPVSLHEKRLIAGDKELAVEYAGNVFLFADAVKQRQFCLWPKRYLVDAPRINAPGMRLGYIIASPCGYRAAELAGHLQKTYGFDVVNIALLIEQALRLEPLEEVRRPAGEDEEEEVVETTPAVPRLTKQEKESMLSGKALGTDCVVRLIACALKIEKNIEILAEHRREVEAAKKALADAAEKGEDKPEHIIVDEEGEPVVPYSEALLAPERGFVLVGFPESAEQVEAVRTALKLEIERVLVLKVSGEEPPDPVEFLEQQGLGDVIPLGPAIELATASFDGLAAVEGLRLEEVPLNADEHQQLVHIRKLIDPFYPVVLDVSMAPDIPDPDEWNQEEAIAAATDENGVIAEMPQRPSIPWGVCGPYCPVTLQEDSWLFPGQKAYQHYFGGRVYALASERVSEMFVAEPIKFVSLEGEPKLPPPRIMITGPTGSTVQRQCDLLSGVYRIPVLQLEQLWRAEVDKRLTEAKAIRMKELLAEKEPGQDDDEEPPPEDDGLDDASREELFVDSMRTVLGARCGACIINGSWFADLEDEEMGEDVRTARSLHNLLIKARRLPDLVVILRAKNDIAFGNVHDPVRIDAEDAELVALAKAQDPQKLRARLETVQLVGLERREAFKSFAAELEGTEEDGPPDPLPDAPDDLVANEEKESERVKAKFIERKKAEQQALKEFAERLQESRAAPQKVSIDRGEDPAHKAIRWHCRMFLEQRPSLFLRHQITKISPSKAEDLLRRGLAMPSFFGDADPITVDAPLFAGRPDAFKHVAELRGRLYYPRSEEELTLLLEQPADYLAKPPPSRVQVHPAVVVSGPPLSGKTTLARQLADRMGAVYLAIPEVLTQLCSLAALPSALSREVMGHLRRGTPIPDSHIIEALRLRLTYPDILRRGWVLDDFPLTEAQAKALEEVGIVPHRFLIIEVEEGQVFARSTAIAQKGSGDEPDLVQHGLALQRDRLDAFNRNSPSLRAYYAATYENVLDLDGSRSIWAVYDRALEEASRSISQRLEYHRRTSQGLAVRVHGMCFTPGHMLQNESAWRKHCPVALTLGNEFVACTDTHFTVEYNSKIFWLSSDEYTGLFVDDPESFLQVPLPAALPQLLTTWERRYPPQCQLEDYCPVALVDRKELIKTSGHHLVRFMDKVYTFQNKEAAMKFVRRPMRYVQRAKLPSKRPALKGDHTVSLLAALNKGREGGRGLETSDMLTFMQASVSELIAQALVDSGEKRPLYPGKSAKESALLFLAKFLRAKNPITTEMYSAKMRGELDKFLSDCAVPGQLLALTLQKDGPVNDEGAKVVLGSAGGDGSRRWYCNRGPDIIPGFPLCAAQGGLQCASCQRFQTSYVPQEAQKERMWTSSDMRDFKELCARFDDLFKLSA